MINIKRFIDVNIVQHVEQIISGTRDTVLLYTTEGSADDAGEYSTLETLSANYDSSTNTYKYAEVYFKNGGRKLQIEYIPIFTDLTANMIKALDEKFICVALVNDSNNMLRQIAQTLAVDPDVYGTNEKIFIDRTMTMPDSSNPTSIKNFCMKYSNVVGAEMTIAAYLSKINVYGLDTVHDYMFTEEILTAENLSDTDYETLVNANYNFDITLANATRNCGGNCTDGADLVNNYVRIILHQTLTERLLNLLVQKLKSVNSIGKIYTTITQELEAYVRNGYLTTDKMWTDENYEVLGADGEQYTIIEKCTALTSGYYVSILPFSALSEDQKTVRSAPPIYVIIADQYGIRKITISGEVI